ncbi:hypothetical protein HYY72_01590 [Candidatus Woesearchaeota archaeon]|nr:hypothetical protein [Candidatus Woesearchaeota archaeon]
MLDAILVRDHCGSLAGGSLKIHVPGGTIEVVPAPSCIGQLVNAVLGKPASDMIIAKDESGAVLYQAAAGQIFQQQGQPPQQRIGTLMVNRNAGTAEIFSTPRIYPDGSCHASYARFSFRSGEAVPQ